MATAQEKFPVNYVAEVESFWGNLYQVHYGVILIFSPLDWAYVDSWKEAGIPLQAVFSGIDRTFHNFKPVEKQKIRRIQYCFPEIFRAAQRLRDEIRGPGRNNG
jgi:hypothetical protein